MSEHGFWNLANQYPDHLALVGPDGTTYTAAELAASSNRIARGLRALGLGQGDCVATLLPNSTAMIEMYLACFQSGLYLTPINHHLTAGEVGYIVADSDAKAFIVDAQFADAAQGAVAGASIASEGLFSIGAVDGFRSFDELGRDQSSDPPEDRSAGQVMNYTSGTTGRPKGVRRKLTPFDPDAVGSMYAMFLAMFGIQPLDDNVHLVGSPLYHTAVLMFTASSLHLGHTIVVMDKWTTEGSLEVMEKQRVTTTHMVPTQFHRLLGLPEDTRKRYDLSSLRHVIHAAAPCPIDVKHKMIDWWGPCIFEYYAASEGGGTLVTPEEWLRYPGTVGRAWAGSEIRILDDDGKQLAANETGTVYMALGTAEFEYHKDQKKTEDNRRDGFFTVGDIGYLNDDGYLFLCDRKIDMIIAGGVNIYPTEIEATLLGHPKVADVAVFGIPHEDWGEEIKAVIEPIEGQEPGDALTEDLVAFAETELAKYKRPRSYDYVAEMPRDPNGKLYKRKLRDPYWEGRDRAI